MPSGGSDIAGRGAAESRPAVGEVAERQRAEQKAAESQPAGGESMGLGVQILEIARMEKALSRTPRLKERVFSEAERQWCESKPNPAAHYALAFAAKGSVAKALGSRCTGMRLRDVEVDRSKRGRPRALLAGAPAAEAARQGVREVYLSLSYTHSTAVASAAAVRDEDVPERDGRRSDVELIAARFKDVRAILDGMDGTIPDVSAIDAPMSDDESAETQLTMFDAPMEDGLPVTEDGSPVTGNAPEIQPTGNDPSDDEPVDSASVADEATEERDRGDGGR